LEKDVDGLKKRSDFLTPVVLAVLEVLKDATDRLSLSKGVLVVVVGYRGFEGKKIVVRTFGRKVSDVVVYDEQAVINRFQVSPTHIPDYKGLVGDKSDNIPGVPGIGPKTACKLIQDYGSIEKMYIEAKEVGLSDEKLRLRLIENEDLAMVSKKLAIFILLFRFRFFS